MSTSLMDLSRFAIQPLRSRDVPLARAWCEDRSPLLLVTAASADHARRLQHELALRPKLDLAWAARPLELSPYAGQLTLLLEDPGGYPLDCQLAGPLGISAFLRLAIGIAEAIEQVHTHGLMHNDIRPSNMLIDAASSRCWLTGFGLACACTQPHPGNPEFPAASLPYVSPEHTGRMDRLVDARSDLYSLGVTLYEMLTGELPFTAAEPLEWIHSHIARQPTAPAERSTATPVALSAIVMKLLAKAPEERYQTGAGVKGDLLHCQAQWDSQGIIAPFPLAALDTVRGRSPAATLYSAWREFDELTLQEPEACYDHWGVSGMIYPTRQGAPLIPPPIHANAGGRSGAAFERLDLATVVKALQAVSSEIEFDKLLDTLMHTALENAGAERGVLLLQQGERLWLQAEATIVEDRIEVRGHHARLTPQHLPQSVVHYALQTRQDVVLGEAGREPPFSQDEYVRSNASRSILCLPLIQQGQVIGALYLENALVSHAFTPARFALLRLLASQTAASLENAHLYSELRDAGEVLAQAQSLGRTGSFRWCIEEGAIEAIEWSAENYRIFEFDPSTRIRLETVLDRVHPDDRARVRGIFRRAIAHEERFESEHRLRRDDGTVKHVRVIGQPIRRETGSLCFIGATLDMTSIWEAQQRLSKAQAELADASRKMRMGEFAALIAHEVTQPLAAILTNAESCLQWLAKDDPNIEKARKAVERITRDGKRAANVIGSIRARANHVVLKMETLNINRLIRETLELIQSDLHRNAIVVDTDLAASAVVTADPTQLQQVVVNLVTNAMEAMAAGAASPRLLRVLTLCGTSEVEVAVEDSGPGIDATLTTHIFEATFTTKPHGMGLGLAICRSIVEAHGGRLWCVPNPSGGSIFRFSLPQPSGAAG